MFEFVRKHTRIMQVILFLLIFPSFVVVGINGYNRLQERGEAVARVDGRDIMQAEWDNAHRSEVDRLRQQMPNLDAKLLDSPEARYATLERMVRDRVLDAAAHDENLSASDQRVASEIQQNLQWLKGPDGRLDIAKYRQFLQTQGMTPEMFEGQVRADLSSRQVLAGLGNSVFAPRAIANAALGPFYERREIQVAMFPSGEYEPKVAVSDADIEAFYKANPQLFQAPEQANIEYLVLDLDSVKKSIAVNEQDVKSYYEQNQARYGTKEERRASHILIDVPKNASPADKEKAKARAEELLAEVKKDPASFAELAKKYSKDPVSAARGGDLDYFTRGAMVKSFEDAVFAMKPGDIRLVESEFGYHVIRLADVKPGTTKTFDEVKPQIEDELKKQQAQRKFAEAADTFTNTVYEQADSLKPAADKLKLDIQTAQNVQREPAAGAKGPLANPKFLAALFSPDATQKKRNTEAVETGPNQMVSGRVVQYMPARTRPLAEVKDDVRKRLVARKAAELAKKEGQDKLAAWKSAPATAVLPAAIVISREDTAKQPRQVADAALRTDPTKLPAFTGVDLGEGGYAVVRVNKVIARPAPPPDAAKQEEAQYARAWATAENLAYYDVLKDRYKVQINVAKPAPLPQPAGQ
ncbi:MAG TPA: SurA N-terminal domain-containing protein [Ramlibacter sp.]|uniref:SurA N-terminal domain-containing protein n=1 Tax=Ramlibacter sp. TaxID=1917967 RepID=UPI002C86E48A|nr:SurA N-terminal domain-containing protein [Ramlibacter sp.]HVZ44416.1 SurA N-terminal domain-containing protein [Ramlibacter sp.]